MRETREDPIGAVRGCLIGLAITFAMVGIGVCVAALIVGAAVYLIGV